MPAEYASPAKSIGNTRKYEIGLRTPPSRTAPRAMKTKVHAAHPVKKAVDHRVDTRRSPSHLNGPMDAARLMQPRIAIARRWGPLGVASAYKMTARAPML